MNRPERRAAASERRCSKDENKLRENEKIEKEEELNREKNREENKLKYQKLIQRAIQSLFDGAAANRPQDQKFEVEEQNDQSLIQEKPNIE